MTFEQAAPGTPLQEGLARIKAADRSFNADEFLAGARTAFEMIIDAFAAGKMADLRPYLADEVNENFARAIRTREAAGETLDTTVVGINESDIIEARVDGKYAFLTIKFVSEQINVTRDKSGAVIDGDPDHVAEVTDIWTFMRDTRSRGLAEGSEGMTLERIGEIMGVTRERIRQIRERAFEKLRQSPDGKALMGFWRAA